MSSTVNNLHPEVRERFLTVLEELQIAFQTVFLTGNNTKNIRVSIEPTQENISVVRAIGQFGKKYTVINLYFNKALKHADGLIDSAKYDELKTFYTNDKQSLLYLLNEFGLSEGELKDSIFLFAETFDPSILEYLQKLEQELKDEAKAPGLQDDIQTLPKNWELVQDKNPQIKRNGTAVYTFVNDWSSKYKYFKCLWQNYGIHIEYKEVYEFESKLHYPENGIWKINRNIRNTINKLRKELQDLPINIETSKGFVMTIQEQ